MFTQVLDPLGNLTLTCLVALIPVVSLLVMLAVFRLPAWLATLIGSIITFVLAAWVWKMPLDDGAPRLPLRRGDRRVERRLDHLLGHGAVQHARGKRRVRELPPLADRAGQHGRARADDAVRLGVRRAARGPGRLRLSVGGRGADPDLARHLRSQRDPRRRDRQQRAGVLRRARRADHRARRGDRLSAAGAVGLGRHRGRGAGAAAAVGADVPGLGQGGNEGRLAARGGRLARLHRRPVSGGRAISGPICPTSPAPSCASSRCCCC